MQPERWNSLRFIRSVCGLTGIALLCTSALGQTAKSVAPGVWKVTFGEPEAFTPLRIRPEKIQTEALGKMTQVDKPPLRPQSIAFRIGARGCCLELPMDAREQVYGLGMRLPSVNATNKRISLLVSDGPEQEDGSGHAPVPFYVSTDGYGVYVDTLRYARFYFGNIDKVQDQGGSAAASGGSIATSTDELYRSRELSTKRVTIDIPASKGVEVYLLAGPTMLDAIRRYNLFSGGGCLPPLWGLGIYYRGFGQYNAEDVVCLAKQFRQNHIPCDVFGLEPGWHSKAYSCSYVWSNERWPDPNRFLAAMRDMNYQLNLWEHAFVHPTALFHKEILPYCGDYEVWDGLVPDFTVPKAREIYNAYHERELVRKGVTGFKLDECDNQPQHDHPWSFPEVSRFPSGMDGEQMHSCFGLVYQRSLADIFRRNNVRTYGQVRASGALAAPMPFVLYSDAYDHRMFVRAILTSGFCGLLWEPELRVANSVPEMYRRIQTMVCSPQAVVNAWFMPHPTWHQIEEAKNKKHELMPNRTEVEGVVRELFRLRMKLIPYLYSAFAEYQFRGTPPFRALVTDYPRDAKTWNIEDEYMMGTSVLVAPIFGNDTRRKVYLPAGEWYCFWTGTKFDGGRDIEVEMPVDRIPMFVQGGTILPLADPVEFVAPDSVFKVTPKVYGQKPQPFDLFEDDGTTYNFETGDSGTVTLSWTEDQGGRVERRGRFGRPRYTIAEWVNVK